MNHTLEIIPRFLRNPDQFFEDIQQGKNVRATVLSLSAVIIVSLTVYGFTVGLAHSWLQALSSAVKMPLLLLSTVAFCLPALYFFSLAVLGTPLRLMQVTAVVLSGVSVTAFLLLGLSPVTLFFVLTSNNYPFFQLLAVIFVAISGSIGVYFLWRGMIRVETVRDDGLQRLGRIILSAWIVLYGFVGTQMTWRLSPLVGDPSMPFVLLRPSRDNFYVDVLGAFSEATGTSLLPATSGWLAGISCVLIAAALVAGVMLGSGKQRPRRSISTPQPTVAE